MSDFKIIPSLFGANISKLKEEVMPLKKTSTEIIHLDMMDGTLVPNIAFGPIQISELKKVLPFQFDVHMMVKNPEKFIPALVEAGVEYISIHQESTIHLLRVILLIKELGAKAGVVVNPGTSIELIRPVVNEIDYILLMTVNPGLGGQKLYPPIFNKIKETRKLIEGRNIEIQVDGGINDQNIVECYKAGANWFVVGSYLFTENINERLISLEKILKKEH